MIIHRADSRGHINHGWLKTSYTFSFAEYHNPQRMHFGKLRVLNDDVIAGGSGFGMHPHNNMEIISIPIKGALRHLDSAGNEEIIDESSVQLMSAGKGIQHAEYNALAAAETNFLQIWIYPKIMNEEPRYEIRSFDKTGRFNRFQLLVSPDGRINSLPINQKAFISRIDAAKSFSATYKPFCENHGVYVFVISGIAELNHQKLHSRDGAAFPTTGNLNFTASIDSDLLIIEVPMR
jgi:redox-sensitive bicupin YhaK (pirin superfamily)